MVDFKDTSNEGRTTLNSCADITPSLWRASCSFGLTFGDAEQQEIVFQQILIFEPTGFYKSDMSFAPLPFYM